MTWDSFDADWTEATAPDAATGDLPYTAAYVRDDGFRIELYTWEGRRIVEVSDPAGDVLGKLEVLRVDRVQYVAEVEGWDVAAVWRSRPTLAVAALRFADRTWPAPPLADDVVIP